MEKSERYLKAILGELKDIKRELQKMNRSEEENTKIVRKVTENLFKEE